MKISLRKLSSILVVAGCAFAFSLPTVAQSPAVVAGEDPRYTYDEVFAACEGAFDTGPQIAACVNNVCGFYGCE